MTTADLQQRVQAECGDMGVKVLDRVQKGASYDEINFFFGEAGVSMAFAIKEMTEKGSGYAGLNNIDLVAAAIQPIAFSGGRLLDRNNRDDRSEINKQTAEFYEHMHTRYIEAVENHCESGMSFEMAVAKALNHALFRLKTWNSKAD